MQQYFILEKIGTSDVICFNDEQAHHIRDVLRMKENTVVRIVDQDNQAAFATIFYEGKKVKASNTQCDLDNNEMTCKITLCLGLIKKEKWDVVLQKCTELGVSRIVPFESSRTIVKAKEDKSVKKLERWNKIMLEAAEQSKRNCVPMIVEPVQFKELGEYKSDCNCVAYEDAKISGEKLKNIVNEKSMTIVIGPEGGLSSDEVEFLMNQGFHCISLGKRTLRAETAAMYVCSAIDALVE